MSTRLSFVFFAFLFSIAACSSAADAPAASPDAAPPRAIDPSGMFVVHSTYALSAPPRELAPLLAELSSATDDYDDPSGYLVDLIVAQLPDGTPRTIATALARYIASYVQERISMYAPDLAPSLRAMATGAERIATRFGTIEELRLVADERDAEPDASERDGDERDGDERDGDARDGDARDGDDRDGMRSASRSARGARSITGVQFDEVAIMFDDVGLADQSDDVDATVERFAPASVPDRISIAKHSVRVPFAAWFRLGFDRAVIPSVVPGATDLASAFRVLVRCPRLGALIADALGVGSASLYANACNVGLGVGAGAIYERFPGVTDSQTYELVLEGDGTAVDANADGVMDRIDDGIWTGRLGDTSITSAVFEGAVR